MHALELDASAFTEYACGTNGGPPARPLKGWADYAQCAPEKDSGLHEVQFRYDDEQEYIARARSLTAMVNALAGTKIYTIPVIISALLDDDGFVVGMRAVSDPRVDDNERSRAVALRNFLTGRYGADDWDCTALPREEGEQPIGSRFIKERCTKTADGLDLSMETHSFRKAGQYAIDPRSGQRVSGLFVSDVRFEERLAAPVPDRQQRLAELKARGPAPSPRDANRARAMDCAGCDLAGIDLKGQDLTGANLAGANLAGADLHRAVLAGADLTGANLTDANLDRATLRQAKMAKARMNGTLLYAAILDGADLSAADLTDARLGEARMVRANLEGATLNGVDASNARLTDARLAGTTVETARFPEAAMQRVDLTGARITSTVLARAQLTGANFTRAVLYGSDLIGANLRDANLTEADFSGTRMTMVVLTNTVRDGAKFEDVEGMPR
jgi:uncharacterized protein YjbI with pentapeptide repeats